jgi:3-hydroxymyristoyl/3-hydroxydecanoyl-(acyl carrier protein) dehydratase
MNEPFLLLSRHAHDARRPHVEAMAQLLGLLLSRKLEHTGKIRSCSPSIGEAPPPVVPGDQLILNRKHPRRARIATSAAGRVGDQVAAEAIKFMMVDNEFAS